jgi:hypothetical protein
MAFIYYCSFYYASMVRGKLRISSIFPAIHDPCFFIGLVEYIATLCADEDEGSIRAHVHTVISCVLLEDNKARHVLVYSIGLGKTNHYYQIHVGVRQH